jgi:hypothetical protein
MEPAAMNPTARILQLLPALGDGGVERSTVEMAAGLGARGIANWVVSGGGDLVAAVEATSGCPSAPSRPSPSSPTPAPSAASSTPRPSTLSTPAAEHRPGPAGWPAAASPAAAAIS